MCYLSRQNEGWIYHVYQLWSQLPQEMHNTVVSSGQGQMPTLQNSARCQKPAQG